MEIIKIIRKALSEEIVEESIYLTQKALNTAVIGSIVLSVVSFWVLKDKIPLAFLLPWLILGFVLSYIRVYLVHRLKPIHGHSADPQTARIQLAYTVTLGCLGLMWGVLSLVTVKYGTPIDHLFITVIIAGASAGSVATVSAIFSAFSVFFLFAVFPVFVSFLLSNVHFLQVTSPLILFFIGIIFSAGKIFHQNMINSILLSRQLTDLNVKLQLEQAKTQQSNEAKSRFISSMSHELRTPLNSIIGFTQLTKLSDSLSEDDLENIEQIDVASQKLLELINNVLYLSNMMSDDVEVQLDMTSIQDEIHRAKNILEHEILKNVITVTCDVDDLTVNADSNLLLQVIIQLFTNAIRYNKMGGKLHIEAHVTPENHVKVSFTDSGKGIHPDYQDKLFTPFERLGEEAGSAAGLGLGLYISKTYIDKMHGHIGYETEHLVGSTFWFELPIFNSKHKES